MCFYASENRSGAVFGFGKNTFGQLGIGDLIDSDTPKELTGLRSLGVRHIAAGDNFSAFLTKHGGVLTCGDASYGQLGSGNRKCYALPRAVANFMGETFTQVVCGSNHILAFRPSNGCIYGFGSGSCGQLGNGTANDKLLPQEMLQSWVKL